MTGSVVIRADIIYNTSYIIYNTDINTVYTVQLLITELECAVDLLSDIITLLSCVLISKTVFI